MTSYIRRTRIAAVLRLALIALSLTVLAGTAAAQDQHRRTVRVAIPDSFPGRQSEPALVIRTGADPLAPVILLNRTKLSEDVVASALATADLLLRRPIGAKETQVMGLASFRQRRPMSEHTHALTTRYLHQLQAQPTTRIGNLGAGRWIEVPAP